MFLVKYSSALLILFVVCVNSMENPQLPLQSCNVASEASMHYEIKQAQLAAFLGEWEAKPLMAHSLAAWAMKNKTEEEMKAKLKREEEIQKAVRNEEIQALNELAAIARRAPIKVVPVLKKS